MISVLPLFLIILGVLNMVNVSLLWTGVAELVVAGLLYATASITTSDRIKMFMYMGMAILIVLAGYQFITAFA